MSSQGNTSHLTHSMQWDEMAKGESPGNVTSFWGDGGDMRLAKDLYGDRLNDRV